MLIPTTKNVKTITDMREDALKLLEDVEKLGLAYIFHRSRPKAVILSIEDFSALQEMLESYKDEFEAKKLSKIKRGTGISLAETAKKYV
ncbi:MAG: hypothetical protein US96_C0058G0001 [Candidatus Woesebacteria bacterium GW2011_GWB1_38_5b]|uniref:Uncharacterized protein n=1 Tax=Candidatus Woesebacteria bacterium GW2011_GWB1_38_5b TaxID=1618569 RepID=A0A0G0N961_9BACT|nr:MAG: hypothetical protein US96_C0058G0001 [Candidatus Woesebacteria bacterium GW2011_GWB1_38_5b]